MYASYIKIGWRNLIRNRSYAMINVSGLALSMTCAIFIFSIVKHNLSFDNFHENPDRIYRIVTETHRDVIAYRSDVPSPLGELFRNDHSYAEKVARVFTERNPMIALRKGNELIKFKEPAGVSFSETTFFEIFNLPLIKGNKETVLVDPNSAILTERSAQKYFGDRDAIGETFWLDNRIPFTVTGILKNLPSNTDIHSEIFVSYSTLKEYDPWLASEQDGWNGIRDGMKCYVLLHSGAPISEIEDVLSAYAKTHRPNSKNIHRYKLQPLADMHFDARYDGAMEKQNLWILSIIGLFLVATACLNFINLASAQALKRAKEVGVRKVLGGAKHQLFWQFILETGMITFAGVFAAGMIASLSVGAVNDFFNTNITVNFFSKPALALFIVVLGLIVTLLSGFYPGVLLSGYQPVVALKGKLATQSAGGFNIRRGLIVTQFIISQVLLIGMVVIMDQMRYAKHSDLGFDKDAIVMVRTGNDSPDKLNAMKNEISRLPGVERISLCFAAPSSAEDWGNAIKIDNSQEEVGFRTSIKSADADYVPMFELEVVAGRNLMPSDSVKEMLVNETMVRKLEFKTAEEAIGHNITTNGGSIRGPIVGVLKDFHDKSLREDINPILITTYSEDYRNFALKVNMSTASATLAAVEAMWSQQHPDQIFEYNFVDDNIARFYEADQSMLRLIQIFSFIAIFIGCLGLYGLVSFMVSQKTKEVGVRKILGGTASHIMWIFGKEFVRLIILAFLVAAPIGWWLMITWLHGFKYQIGISPLTFVLAITSTLVVASITVCSQVIKTAYTNPVNSLRTE